MKIKTIFTYTAKIMYICKNGTFEDLQEFIKSENLNNDYLNDCELYGILLDVVFELCDPWQIKNMFIYNLSEVLRRKEFKINEIHPNISYRDLCDMIILKIRLLPVNKTLDDEIIPLYRINDNGKIVDINTWINGEKELIKCKTNTK